MSMTKRHWKLQEFVAHTPNVNCLALGRQSGRVMVTGGDDKKIHIYAVGKPNILMSIPGHSTAVESVQFDPRENVVCGGSSAGAVKAWDLESVKMIRTLTGHKGNVRCIDFHPYGDLIASGSLDTTIRLWDARSKGCIYIYKGHNKGVNTLKFSPDGKWLASGGENGIIRLWDLNAGKKLTEFTDHTASVSSVEFHPTEFLLATGSSDKSVKFWDLESFQLVSSSENESLPVRCLCFHSSGSCIFSGSLDSLKVHGWEPSCTFDSLVSGWGKVAHMVVAQNQLIAGSFSMNSVSVHVVQLSTLNPLKQMDNTGEGFHPAQELKTSPRIRRNFSTDPSSRKLCDIDVKIDEKCLNPDDDLENDNLDSAVVEPHAVFVPRSELCRTPPKTDPFPVPLDGDDFTIKSNFMTNVHQDTKPIPVDKFPFPTPDHPEKYIPSSPCKIGSPLRSNHPTNMVHMKTSYSSSSVTMPVHTPPSNDKFIVNSPKMTHHFPMHSSIGGEMTNQSSMNASTMRTNYYSMHQATKPIEKATAMRRQTPYPPEAVSVVRPTMLLSEKDNAPQRAVVMPEQLKTKLSISDFVPQQRDKPAGLSVDEFLPKALNHSLSICDTYQTEMSEAEAMNIICRENQSILSVLSSRGHKLKIIAALLRSKDPKFAVDAAIHMKDNAILVDVLGVLNRHASIWSLDVCQSLLPSLQDLLESKYESYMSVGCDALRLILKKFGSVIKSNVQAAPSIGVDLCGEERASKCKSCYENLLGIRSFIMKRQTMQGELGQSFRELLKIMCSDFNAL